MDYQQHIMNLFTSIQLKDNESVFDFNKRFHYVYRNVIGSGQQVSEEKRIHIYLRALRQHHDPRILYEVKSMTRDLLAHKSKPISELQRLLLKEEEYSNTTINSMQSTGKRPVRSTRRANYVNNTPSRRPQSSNRQNSRSFDGECHGCKKRGHILRYCPYTSVEDKRKIYTSLKNATQSYQDRPTNQMRTTNSSQG